MVKIAKRMSLMVKRKQYIKVLFFRVFCFIAILAGLVLPSAAEEVLLAAQQPFDLGDGTTLVVEDVDPQRGVVWLGVYSENEALNSAVLHMGEHFRCGEMDLAVTRIYAGGEGDLISLEINGEGDMGISNPLASESEPVSNERPKKSPGFCAALPALTLIGYSLIKDIV
ncbi:MAG: hypothetical protein QUS09_04795 [Methanotrichaceae archaeon]|nr:hypothetical protein [Methanotrichaceae archaeon]